VRYEENGAGVLDVPRETADRIFDLAGRAQHHRDAVAARDLADLAESHGAVIVAGYSVVWWRNYATLCDEAARTGSAWPVRRPDDPTTTGEPMSDDPERALYVGTAPTALRIDYMSDRVRLRIEGPGVSPAAIVDLRGPDIDDLVETLTARPDRLR
jgi:hypothetical protein